MVFLSYFMHAHFSKISHIFEDKYDRQNKLKESQITSIIWTGKKAAYILISKLFFAVKKLAKVLFKLNFSNKFMFLTKFFYLCIFAM